MPGPEECFESKQALNARFRESNRNISPIEKDYHTNLKECKNDILFIAYGSVIFHGSEYRNTSINPEILHMYIPVLRILLLSELPALHPCPDDSHSFLPQTAARKLASVVV